MTTYVTFGQDHRHEIDGKVFDKDCIAVIESNTPQEGRNKAFEIFGPKFCFEYSSINQIDMKYFSRGLINVE